jgi:putative membrane protein
MTEPTPQAFSLPGPDAAKTRAPQAFVLAGDGETKAGPRVEIHEQPEPTDMPAPPKAVEPTGRWFSLGTLFWTGLSLLVTLYLADAGWSFVQSLAAKEPRLGQMALGLIALVVGLGLLFILREMFGILRLRTVTRLRQQAEAAATLPAVKTTLDALVSFYRHDATTAQARAELVRMQGEIHDAPTLMAQAERSLLKAKDQEARRLIAEAAQRVSLVTALSPRAIVDLAFVLGQSFSLIRQLSALYGGRASGFGLWRLGVRVVSHLAITGGMAVADSALGQIIGSGMAARLSAKLGEGVLNGVLTARVGIAALDLCRPLPFRALPPVKLSEVAKISLTP